LGDRTSIFVCALCGDLDRGATSMLIEREGDEIVWRDWTPSGWVREDGLPLPEDMDKIVGAHTYLEGFEAWPAELRFDYREYREAIVNRPASSITRRRRRR
jgi:hypothetical protein